MLKGNIHSAIVFGFFKLSENVILSNDKISFISPIISEFAKLNSYSLVSSIHCPDVISPAFTVIIFLLINLLI